MAKKEKNKTEQIEVRRIKRNLKCKFTDVEILQLGKDLAEKTELYGQIEADKKQMSKEFDAKLAEAEAGIRSASGKIQSGYEYRNIECTESIGEPDGKKTVRRLDSNEVFEVRDLTDDEKQRHLQFIDDQPATAEKIAELLPNESDLHDDYEE